MPIPAAAVPIALQLGSTIAGKAIGGKKKTESATPDDLQPMRQQQIALLQYLTGMGPDPRLAPKSGFQNNTAVEWLVRRMGGDPSRFMTPAPGPTNVPMSPQAPAFNPASLPLFGQPGMADGGMVQGPGGPTSDQVPAMLSNGEGVLNTGAVDQLGGPQIVHLLNALGMAQRMANGGIAGQQLPMQGVPPMATGGLPPAPPPPGVETVPQGQNPVLLPPQAPAPAINLAQPGTGGGQVPQAGGGMMTPQQRLESFFGPLGITPSNLQQQAGNAYQRMLQQPTPEQRAAEISLPQLQQNLSGNPTTQQATNGLMGLQTGAGADVEGRLGQIGQRPITGSAQLDQILQSLGGLGGGGGINFGPSGLGISQLQQLASSNPGQGVVQALDPSYQRNLAAANQQGGRFGSGNAILHSRALDDYNLAAQQAMQRGVDQQTAAASALGQLGLGGDSLRLQGLLGGQQGQLDALRLATQGSQGLDQSALGALGQLGGFRLQGQGQQAQNLQAAGNLGLGQGQLGNQAAGVLGGLFGQQGQAERGLVGNAFGAGTALTGQENVGNQRAIDLINQMLQTSQGASLGGPVTQTPSGAQQGADFGSQAAQYYLMSQYLNNQGGGGG